jgi:hypothetical protein
MHSWQSSALKYVLLVAATAETIMEALYLLCTNVSGAQSFILELLELMPA